jgi:hypothetical protein
MFHNDPNEDLPSVAGRLYATIEGLKNNLVVIEENLKALSAFEDQCNPGATTPPPAVRNLERRRDNLLATIFTLQKRLDVRA